MTDMPLVYPPFVEANGIRDWRLLPPADGEGPAVQIDFEDGRWLTAPYDRISQLVVALGVSDAAALVNVPIEVRSDPRPGYVELDRHVYVGPARP